MNSEKYCFEYFKTGLETDVIEYYRMAVITYIPPGERLSEQVRDVVVDDVGRSFTMLSGARKIYKHRMSYLDHWALKIIRGTQLKFGEV